MFHKAFQYLIFCDYSHKEFHFIAGILSSKSLDQLYGLPLSWILIFHIDSDIFEPQFEYQISHGRVCTL